jgi:hypothetical protein
VYENLERFSKGKISFNGNPVRQDLIISRVSGRAKAFFN